MTLLPWLFSAAIAATPPAVSVGQPAYVFTLPALNEDAAMDAVNKPQVALADFAGVSPGHSARAVVLYFFLKDEGGDELAVLHRLQRRYSGKGVQVVAISADVGDLGALSTWVEGQKLSFPVLRDNHRVVTSRYGVVSLPMTILVDHDGYVFSIGQPDPAHFESELESELAPLIAR